MNDSISTLRANRNESLKSAFGDFWQSEIIEKRSERDKEIDREIQLSEVQTLTAMVKGEIEAKLPSHTHTALELMFMKDIISDTWLEHILNDDDTLNTLGVELASQFRNCPHSLTNGRGQALENPEERAMSAGISTIKARILNLADRAFAWHEITDPAQVAQIIRNSTHMLLIPASVQIEQFPKEVPGNPWTLSSYLQINPNLFSPKKPRLSFNVPD